MVESIKQAPQWRTFPNMINNNSWSRGVILNGAKCFQTSYLKSDGAYFIGTAQAFNITHKNIHSDDCGICYVELYDTLKTGRDNVVEIKEIYKNSVDIYITDSKPFNFILHVYCSPNYSPPSAAARKFQNMTYDNNGLGDFDQRGEIGKFFATMDLGFESVKQQMIGHGYKTVYQYHDYLNVSKVKFFTILFNGCVKAYYAKGPLNLVYFQRGIQNAIRELDQNLVKPAHNQAFYSVSIPSSRDKDINLFSTFGYKKPFSVIQVLRQITREANEIAKKFEVDMKAMFQSIATTLEIQHKIKLFKDISDEDLEIYAPFIRFCMKTIEAMLQESKGKNGLKDKDIVNTFMQKRLEESDAGLNSIMDEARNFIQGIFRECEEYDAVMVCPIKDLLRCRVSVRNPEQTITIIKTIEEQGYIIKEIKNNMNPIERQKRPDAPFNFMIIIQYGKFYGEIQIIPAMSPSEKLAYDTMHAYYEITRHELGVFYALAEKRDLSHCWYQ